MTDVLNQGKILVFGFICVIFLRCYLPQINITNPFILFYNDNRSVFYVCPDFHHYGRLGNKLFLFASSYGIAKANHMRLFIGEECPLLDFFEINVFHRLGYERCRSNKIMILKENRAAAFDRKMIALKKNRDIRPVRYLQSYLYFDNFSADLRNILTFKKGIKQQANNILNLCLKEHQYNSSRTTFVGVHIRRGDLVFKEFKQGLQVATKEYFSKAVKWYTSKYSQLLFVVASDDMKWAKNNMPTKISVSYLINNTAIIDFATLSFCNHSIMSVGTFGWWASWLTGGNVTYYKWPAAVGSVWRENYGKHFSDYFYPNWVGLK